MGVRLHDAAVAAGYEAMHTAWKVELRIGTEAVPDLWRARLQLGTYLTAWRIRNPGTQLLTPPPRA